ncbi:hypothetical protein N0V83_005382 [Neocucurbitaria cava]|uniref:2EXR domain-containing protein n=1 Tax=Neocucurbitaria cava TaxID=798079 RepID=A0A9W8Y9Z2_9PLEO|nr:hypothetical protein N0V83_005382 [Neocucurbitaria cava]
MAHNDFPGDVVMTTDSPSQSFASSQGENAMDIDDGATPPTSSSVPLTAPTDKEQLLYTTGVPLTTFHPFPRLTATLRARIWTLALPLPRTRFLEIHGYNTIDFTPKIRYIPALPPLFHTSHESRALSIASEGGSGGSTLRFTRSSATKKVGAAVTTMSCYFNFSRCVIYLSTRFTPACNTTETFRLHTLATMLPKSAARKIQRLLVTYSGFDDYSRIGPVMRPYANLEVMYIGMVDRWSNRVVRRMVVKGSPEKGVVAGKIEGVVRATEAEETDDDEESDELLGRRVRVRERRRILEVDARLDG